MFSVDVWVCCHLGNADHDSWTTTTRTGTNGPNDTAGYREISTYSDGYQGEKLRIFTFRKSSSKQPSSAGSMLNRNFKATINPKNPGCKVAGSMSIHVKDEFKFVSWKYHFAGWQIVFIKIDPKPQASIKRISAGSFSNPRITSRINQHTIDENVNFISLTWEMN